MRARPGLAILSLPPEIQAPGPAGKTSRKELTGHEQPHFAWLPPRAPPLGRRGGPGSAGSVRDPGLPGTVSRADAPYAAAGLDVLDPAGRPDAQILDLAGIPGAAGRDHYRG